LSLVRLELFRGYSGYILADAKSVYDLLHRPPEQRPPPDDGEPDLGVRTEVGCWSHYLESGVVRSGLALGGYPGSITPDNHGGVTRPRGDATKSMWRAGCRRWCLATTVSVA
jgi:hypothetical protein